MLSFFIASNFKTDSNNLQSPINFTISDTSANERVSYYNEAFSLFLDNPFLGIGLGNWKIVSIETHSEFIQSYFIPYHVHNDFLQFLSETGFFGFLSYISLFFFLFFFTYNIYKHHKFSHELYFVYVALVCYLIDSLLNFPMARPLMLSSFAIIIIFILNHVKTFSKSIRFSTSFFIPILILITLFTVFSTFFVYDSFSKQTYLLNDFKAQKFDTDISIIKDINSVYPNITATGLPIDALKSNYFMSNIDTTLILLNKASKANPYIMYPEFLKSIQLLKLNQFDSAFYYSQKAFYSLPNNEFHAVNYLKNLSFKNDSLEMDRVYDITSPMKSKAIIYNYLKERSLTSFKPNDPRFLKILDSNADIIEEDRLEPLKLIFKYGLDTVKSINILSNKGEDAFNSNKYLEAANCFLKAYEIIPDPSYLENAAHSYFLANYNNNAENILSNLISNKLSKSGKAHYLYGLLQFEISNKNRGCDFLTESFKMGYKDSAQAINQLCK